MADLYGDEFPQQMPDSFACLNCGHVKGKWHCPPRLSDKNDICFWLVCLGCGAIDNNDEDDRRVEPSQREEKT